MVQPTCLSDHQDECTEKKHIPSNALSTVRRRKGTQGRREAEGKSYKHSTVCRPHPVVIYVDKNRHICMDSSSHFTPDERRKILRAALPPYQQALQRICSSSAQPPSANKTHPNARISLADMQHRIKGGGSLPASNHRAAKIQSLKRSGKRRRSSSGNASWCRRSDKTSPVVEHFNSIAMEEDETCLVGITIGDLDQVREYLCDAFALFQQINCRTLCKSWIRTIEPKKQVNHPYNGNLKVRGAPPSDPLVQKELDPEETKPKWWPSKDICPHKEPDHIKKEERLGLLCHILMSTKELHQCSTQDLKNATNADKAKIKPSGNISILDDVWKIGVQLERYKNSEIDATTMVYVTSLKEEARMARGGGRPRKPAYAEDSSNDEGSADDSKCASDAPKKLIAKKPSPSASSIRYLKFEETLMVPQIHLDTRGYGESSSTRRFRALDDEVHFQGLQGRYSMPLEVKPTLGGESLHESSGQVFGGEGFAESSHGDIQDIRGHGNLFPPDEQQAIAHWAIPATPDQYPMHYTGELSQPPAINALDRDHIFGQPHLTNDYEYPIDSYPAEYVDNLARF